MKKFLTLFFLLAAIMAIFGLNQNFAQDQDQRDPVQYLPPENENPVIPQGRSQEGQATQWLWGEVISVDPQKNELVVKYTDYDTDQGKEVPISADAETTFENAKAITDIKPLDTVGIDYSVNMEGKNIAKNISVEKPEIAATSEAASGPAVPEAKPEETQNNPPSIGQ